MKFDEIAHRDQKCVDENSCLPVYIFTYTFFQYLPKSVSKHVQIFSFCQQLEESLIGTGGLFEKCGFSSVEVLR